MIISYKKNSQSLAMVGGDNKAKLLLNLQSLRAFAFLGIFICHTHVLNNVLECLGGWGVSIFLVLSGFVMVYSYYDKNRIHLCNITANIKFAYSKLKKLWLLSFLSVLAMSVFSIFGSHSYPCWNVILKLFLNAFFIQEYFPLNGRSFGTVNWFLCTILLGYFIFPFFLKILESSYSIIKAIFSILICILIEILIAKIGSKFPSNEVEQFSMLEQNLTTWFVYYFPFTRVVDIIIGFNLGYIFITQKKKLTLIQTTFFEVLGIFLAVLGNFYYVNQSSRMLIGDNALISFPEDAWTYSLPFVFSSIMLVYSFAMQNGVISKLLTNRVTLYLAKLSPIAFLMQSALLSYMSVLYNKIPGFERNEFFNNYGCWISLSFGFMLLITATELWMRLYKTLVNIFNKSVKYCKSNNDQ